MALSSSLAKIGALVLNTADPLTKSKLSHMAYSLWHRQNFPIKEIPAPKSSGLPLNAYMLHNLAHVELNAIDLAWDTVVRFSPHSELLGEGFFFFFYGDMLAHNLLWKECEKSSHNVAAHLAAVPLKCFGNVSVCEKMNAWNFKGTETKLYSDQMRSRSALSFYQKDTECTLPEVLQIEDHHSSVRSLA
ncbi:hypothetical protein CsSME_00032699 [Camellia sinensis var. sinensis]